MFSRLLSGGQQEKKEIFHQIFLNTNGNGLSFPRPVSGPGMIFVNVHNPSPDFERESGFLGNQGAIRSYLLILSEKHLEKSPAFCLIMIDEDNIHKAC
jgi:hypothetical protein